MKHNDYRGAILIFQVNFCSIDAAGAAAAAFWHHQLVCVVIASHYEHQN